MCGEHVFIKCKNVWNAYIVQEKRFSVRFSLPAQFFFKKNEIMNSPALSYENLANFLCMAIILQTKASKAKVRCIGLWLHVLFRNNWPSPTPERTHDPLVQPLTMGQELALSTTKSTTKKVPLIADRRRRHENLRLQKYYLAQRVAAAGFWPVFA